MVLGLALVGLPVVLCEIHCSVFDDTHHILRSWSFTSLSLITRSSPCSARRSSGGGSPNVVSVLDFVHRV